ncbi:menaquinone-dependent protoporphyrinogen oxidase [Streptomyces sp. 846.5]|nr:flavodoxin domain-containing protein [Streptomyces sp. 846.5]TDT97353.1 menaquinone-dependent protoporphyrinogen oxidase [Streptomyces sp. 846.5]
MTTASSEHDFGPRRVLVAYGTRHGSTRAIADLIGATLVEDGCKAEVLPAGQVRDVNGFDAVVLGGALYASQWHRDARRFARRHGRSLHGRPVWLFSSGPLDDSANQREIPPVPGAVRAARRLQARGHTTFGGRLAPDASGYLARALARRGAAGDYQDAEQISTWAHGIAAQLEKEPRG